MSRPVLVSSPAFGIVRVSGAQYKPYSSPPWLIDPQTGRLAALPQNRFDDIGPTIGLQQSQWFQTIYGASSVQGSFGELLAARRRSGRAARVVHEHAQLLSESPDVLAKRADPSFPEHGTVSRTWRQHRLITPAALPLTVRCIDIGHPATLTFLLREFLPYLRGLGADLLPDGDFDLSDVMSRNRRLTQHLARFLYELPRNAFDELSAGEEIAGICYLSRHSAAWECWALFADRVAGKLEIGESRSIAADDPDLLAVARQFGLSIETDTPGEYLRPWRDLV